MATKVYQTLTLHRSGKIRRAMLHGRQHVVVPCVMMGEGIWEGSDGPIFYPGDEFNKSVSLWNHKPVVVYHPENGGLPISACDPDVLNNQGCGVLLNTKYHKKDKKIRTEVWLDEARTNEVDDRIIPALEANEKVEVSTGLYLAKKKAASPITHGDKTTVWTSSNYKPDHLALLPDKEGAFSIADGGGLLANEKAGWKARTIRTPVGPRYEVTFNDGRKQIVGDIININEMSFDEVRAALQSALASKYGEPGKSWSGWVVDVYPTECVFMKNWDYGSNRQLWQIDYKKSDKGVTLSGEAVQVVRKSEYVTAANQQTDTQPVENDMAFDKTKHIGTLIGNGFEESDRAWLEKLTDDQLVKIPPKTVTNASPPTPPSPPPPPPPTPPGTPGTGTGTNPRPVSLVDLIANAPAEVQDQFNELAGSYNKEKTDLIGAIKASKANEYTDAELAAMPVANLRKLAKLAGAKTAKSKVTLPIGMGGEVGADEEIVDNEEDQVTNYGGANGAGPVPDADEFALDLPDDAAYAANMKAQEAALKGSKRK